MQIIKHNNLTWIDINNPTPKDIEYLKDNFHFDQFILDELFVPTVRPKVEEYNHYLFMVLHFPIFIPRKKRTFSREIDFIITKDAIITAHYAAIEPLQVLFDSCSLSGANKEKAFGKNTGNLLYKIIEALFEFSFRELNHIQQKIDEVEEEISRNPDATIIEDIAIVRRDVANFIRTVRPQKTIFNSLAIRGSRFFGEQMEPYITDMLGDYARVMDALENHKEIIEALHDTHESLLTTRTNEIMKTLTILALTVFPLTLIAAIFSMNTQIMPIVGQPNDFWIILGIMLASTIGIFSYFKMKKWL